MAFFTKEQKGKAKYAALLILIGMVIGALIVGIFVLSANKQKKDDDKRPLEITSDFVEKKLENLSELSTAQMIYSGLCTVESGKIPLISKKGFSMVYQGEVKAGIDVSKMQIDVSDSKVLVILPAAEVLDSHVDPKSVQFFDEKHALFNRDEKTDVTEALAMAEDDMAANANTDGLLDRANQQAEIVVRGLLTDVVGEREISIMRK